MTWQRIDSAPKDGTTVLGYFAGRNTGAPFDLITWMQAGEHSAWHFDGTYHHEPGKPQPTHWIAIPDPPADAAG